MKKYKKEKTTINAFKNKNQTIMLLFGSAKSLTGNTLLKEKSKRAFCFGE